MRDDRLYWRRADVLWRRSLDGLIVLSTEAGSATHITSPGDLIWAALESPITLRRIGAIVGERFAVSSDSVMGDVRSFLDELDRIHALSSSAAGRNPHS